MQTQTLRDIFLNLISFFPNLDLSITCSDEAQLHIRDSCGDSFSYALNLLDDSELQVREAIFAIKEKLRLFDA